MTDEETAVTLGMSKQALDCRSDGHSWLRFSEAVPVIKKGQLTFVVTRTCRNECGCEREDEYAIPTLELVSRRMHYPRDENGEPIYLMPAQFRGTGRMPRIEARRAQFGRIVHARSTPGKRTQVRASSRISAS